MNVHLPLGAFDYLAEKGFRMARKGSRKKRSTSKKKATPKHDFRLTKADALPLAGVLLITAVCFLRARGYDFVNWDDDFNITKNPNLRNLDWANIKGIFTSHVIGNYNPLTTLSFAIEKHLFGLDPAVFHTTNVVLHLVCTFLAYRFTRLLGLSVTVATIVAFLFGVHPMKVESVVWITERKDVLYSAFYLGALINYVKWYRSGLKNKYIPIILVLFTLSLLSKIQAVALPLSMLCLDYYFKRAWPQKPLIPVKLILEKWYYFALSLLIGLIGIYFLGEQGSLNATSAYNMLDRIVIGTYSFSVYILKFFVPFRISPLYPYPGVIPWYIYASPALFAGLVAIGVVAFRKNWRPLFFGLAFFTVNIMFVLQVVGAGQAFLADRFVYIPYLGLSIAAAHYLSELIKRGSRSRMAALAIMAVWGVGLLAITWIHVPVWKNSNTLWSHVLKYYQNSALPYRNRAQYYRENGQTELALADYERSIALKQDPDVVNSRARLYFNLQNWPKALEDYDLAIQLDPNVGEYWINRGAVYAMLGNFQQAEQDMTQGITLDPDFLNGYKNRSLVYQRLGKNAEALRDIEQYLAINPYDHALWYEGGRLYRHQQGEHRLYF